MSAKNAYFKQVEFEQCCLRPDLTLYNLKILWTTTHQKHMVHTLDFWGF